MTITQALLMFAFVWLGMRCSLMLGRKPRGAELQQRIEQLERELGIGE